MCWSWVTYLVALGERDWATPPITPTDWYCTWMEYKYANWYLSSDTHPPLDMLAQLVVVDDCHHVGQEYGDYY